MSFHHERIHYARQGSVALNAQERRQDASKGGCILLQMKHPSLSPHTAQMRKLHQFYEVVGFPAWVSADELFNSGERAFLCSTGEEQKRNNDAPTLLLFPGNLDRRETSGVCFLPPAQTSVWGL